LWRPSSPRWPPSPGWSLGCGWRQVTTPRISSRHTFWVFMGWKAISVGGGPARLASVVGAVFRWDAAKKLYIQICFGARASGVNRGLFNHRWVHNLIMRPALYSFQFVPVRTFATEVLVTGQAIGKKRAWFIQIPFRWLIRQFTRRPFNASSDDDFRFEFVALFDVEGMWGWHESSRAFEAIEDGLRAVPIVAIR